MAQRLAAWLCWSLLGLALGPTITLRADNRILIPVKINDQAVRFAFDTGASEIILMESAAEKLGLRIIPPPPDAVINPGQARASRTEPLKIELLGQAFAGVQLAVVEDPPQQVDIDGVVGWPNMRTNRVFFHGATLNCNLLAALPPETATWTKLQERRDWTILSLALPRPADGKPAYLGVDTGNPDGVFLAPPAWTQWRAAHPRIPTSLLAYFTPGAGLVVSEVAWADEIDLHGLKLRGVPVSSMDSSAVSLFPPGTAAVVGLAALRRMDLVFDGEGGVYVQNATTPPPPYIHNRLGAVFMPDLPDSDALVAHVLPKSPAAKAGLRDGDILLKIDRLDVTPWQTQPGILPLSRFWQQPPGTKLRLKYERAGKECTADVVLRNLLGPVEK